MLKVVRAKMTMSVREFNHLLRKPMNTNGFTYCIARSISGIVNEVGAYEWLCRHSCSKYLYTNGTELDRVLGIDIIEFSGNQNKLETLYSVKSNETDYMLDMQRGPVVVDEHIFKVRVMMPHPKALNDWKVGIAG